MDEFVNNKPYAGFESGMEKSAVEGKTETKAPRKRGVSNKTHAVSQLRFHEKDAAQNGLFIGHLEDVNVDYSKNENSKSFPNMNVPRLTFHFTSNHSNVSELRHVYRVLFPIESNIDTIPGGQSEWMVNNVFNWIKHVLDVYYLKGRELTEEEENALDLDFIDYDDNGAYLYVDPDDVLRAYARLFRNAAAMLNGSFGKSPNDTIVPCYKTADGKPINCWMKLLRHKKRKGEWVNIEQNGELGFDTFIGNGCIELVKGQNPPTVLRLDLAKESITPKETKKVPNLGGIPGNPVMGGTIVPNIPSMGAQGSEAFMAAQDDMPF